MIVTRELTNRQRDHRLIRVRFDDDVLHNRSNRIMRSLGDVGGADVPTFTKTGYRHLVARPLEALPAESSRD